MFKHMFMVTKTITVTEDAYNSLKTLKKKEESFSEAITRTYGKKINLLDFAGTLSKESADKIFGTIKKNRELSRKKMEKINNLFKK